MRRIYYSLIKSVWSTVLKHRCSRHERNCKRHICSGAVKISDGTERFFYAYITGVYQCLLDCSPRHKRNFRNLLLLFAVMITFVICAQMLSCSSNDVLFPTWIIFVHCGHDFVMAVMLWLSAPTQRIMVKSELLHKCRLTWQQYSTQCPICSTVQCSIVQGLVLPSQQVPTNAFKYGRYRTEYDSTVVNGYATRNARRIAHKFSSLSFYFPFTTTVRTAD